MTEPSIRQDKAEGDGSRPPPQTEAFRRFESLARRIATAPKPTREWRKRKRIEAPPRESDVG